MKQFKVIYRGADGSEQSINLSGNNARQLIEGIEYNEGINVEDIITVKEVECSLT